MAGSLRGQSDAPLVVQAEPGSLEDVGPSLPWVMGCLAGARTLADAVDRFEGLRPGEARQCWTGLDQLLQLGVARGGSVYSQPFTASLDQWAAAA